MISRRCGRVRTRRAAGKFRRRDRHPGRPGRSVERDDGARPARPGDTLVSRQRARSLAQREWRRLVEPPRERAAEEAELKITATF